MPAEHLTAGFYGKIPTTGDFVSRGLAGAFVRAWDRWVATHLAPLQSSSAWPESVGLRLVLGPEANGPVAGVVLPSRDRAGRRFPLTVACPVPAASTGLVSTAARWFDTVEAVADTARRGELTADEFAAALRELPFPAIPAEGRAITGIALWTRDAGPIEIDALTSSVAIEPLLAASVETG
jgi:type VI secretion system protein ImpM